ncbi:solute carrier family 41 member 3 [Harpegnathos saltator]|uniref:Solute carrier family 41 member 2 n=1 Tax=Harpegnathos saltator TaxID=610380 RepID=E2BPL7_HARSA|nr:solute carrier family 41 member 3 [Harpegnathos saltator]EFN82421.1 Solute carrier family 41 member 2 [Harpegnathos saltator]
MVVFPHSVTEPVFLNGDGLRPPNYEISIDVPESISPRKVKDEAFTIPRVTMANGKTNYALEIENIDKIGKMDTSKENINAEPVIVKKVAAGLKCSNGQDKDNKGMSGDNPDDKGGGSFSSGSSIVTITSSASATSGPDPNDPNGPKGNGNKVDIRTEKWCYTILQVSVPFFVAGVGTIGAGYILNTVKNRPVFKEVSQLLILVPALLGLKGNLDMCLASRLSTQVNLGNMHNFRETVKMIIGNIVLVQIQAIVAATCVALFAMTVGAITMNNTFVWNHAVLLATSSISTATSSCFILDFLLIGVIMLSYRFKMNPDNLATPLAASFGDVVSISVLSGISSQLYLRLDNEIWILYVVLAVYIFMLLPCWVVIVLKNKYTKKVLKSGWVPVLSALFISGFGGLILDRVVNVYQGFAIFQPIINGIGGNLVSVQASRTSTMLHQSSIMGILPPSAKIFVAPWRVLFKGLPTAKTARLLIGMAIVGQLIFVFVADYVNDDNCTLHAYFVVAYLIVSVIQVMFLLYIAHIMIHAMWRYKMDPDNSAIPYLTALGDLSGSLFLALAFWFIYAINKQYCASE